MTSNGRVITSTVDALKSQPMVLALILINLVFLAAGGYFMSRISDGMRARDAALIELLKDCRKG